MKKLLCSVLSIIMILSITAGIDMTAYAATGSDVVSYARQFIGYPYVYGTQGPNSFDCSGFVQYVFKHFGISLPASSSSYWNNPGNYGTVVGTGSTANAKAGDVISWSGHVAIYTENGYCVEALNPKYGVCEKFKVDAHTNGLNYKVIRINGISNSSGSMTIPTITISRNNYYVGEKVNITWAATSSNTDFYQYWLIIKNTTRNQLCYEGSAGSDGNPAKNSYIFTIPSEGNYSITVYAVPYNDKNNRQKVSTKTFYASTNGMTTPTITIERNNYYIGEKVNITWEATSSNTDFYQYWLIIKNTTRNQLCYGGSAGSDGNPAKNSYIFTIPSEGNYSITVYSVPYYNKETRQKVSTKTFIASSTHTHTYDAGIIIKPATCVTNGIKQYTCTVCGEEKTEEIPAAGHRFEEYEAVEPTETEPGNIAYNHCTECGKNFPANADEFADDSEAIADVTLPPVDVFNDEESGITVDTDKSELPEDTELVVTVKEETEDSVTYDISLQSGGVEVQPTGSVTVKIPVPKTMDGESVKVYRVESDGTMTDMNAAYKDGYMVFTTEHFSEYMLKTESSEVKGELGDVNGDGNIDPLDVLIVKRYIAEFDDAKLEGDAFARADVSGDGKVDPLDVLFIMQKIAEIIDSFDEIK